MKTLGNNPVSWSKFEIHTLDNKTGEMTGLVPGLTKREYFAALAFQSLIVKVPLHDAKGEHGITSSKEDNWLIYLDVGESAARYADALIEALNKESGK